MKAASLRALCVAIVLFAGISAFAQTNYTSIASGAWNNASNWSPNGVPGAGDNVTITGGNSITVTSNETVDSVTLDATGNNTLVLATGGTLNLESVGSALTLISAPATNLVQFDGGTIITPNGGSVSIQGGISGVCKIDFNANGGTLTVSGDILFSGTIANAQITFSGLTGTVNVGGDLGSGGTIVSAGSTFVFNGSGSQTIGGTYTLYDVEINKTGTATLAVPLTVNGNLTITNGILDDGGQQISLNSGNTSSVTIGSNGVLKLGAAASSTQFPNPVNGANVLLAANSAVVYQAGVPQTIDTGFFYQRLFLQTTGGSVTHSFTGPALNVLGSLEINDNGLNTVTLDAGANNLDVDGDINGDGTVSITTGIVHIGGHWSATGSLTAGNSSKVAYDGNGAQSVLGATYYDLEINKASGTASLGGSVTTNGALTINGGTLATGGNGLTVTGAFTNNATFDPGSSAILFLGNVASTGTFTPSSATFKLNGTASQTFSSSSTVTISTLEMNNAVGASITSTGFTINGTLLLNGGNLDVSGSFFIDVLATVTRNSGWIVGAITMGMNPTPARTFHIGTATSYLPVDVDSGSAGTLTLGAQNGQQPNRTGNNVLDRYWQISAPSSIVPIDSITFHYNAGDITNGTDTKFILARYDGATWSRYGDVVDESPRQATLTNVSTYLGDWVIGQPGSTGGAGQLAITSVNSGTDPSVNDPFDVVVEARNDSSNPANVDANTTVTLTLQQGSGLLGGTLTGTINAATNSTTISGVLYDTIENNVILRASASGGDPLDFGDSALFNVLAPPSTLTVTTLADSGPGSLRDAITSANGGGCSAPCTIEFSVAGTIVLSSALPAITVSQLTINGFSAPGASANTNSFGQPSNAVLTVALDGQNTVTYGLDVQATFFQARGLAIGNFTSAGIVMTGDNSGSNINGCYIGTDMSGTTAASNGTGILINNSAEASIGGTSPGMRNVISGHSGAGVGIVVTGTSNTISITGNYIGTRADLAGSLANYRGIQVSNGTSSVSIGTSGIGNVVSGNTDAGVYVDGSGVSLQANLIGTAGSAATPLANQTGVLIGPNALNVTVGGVSPSHINTISGNTTGISIESNDHVVDNNRIGIAADGTTALGNTNEGIRLEGAAANNQIGTTFGNVIANNQRGIATHPTATGIGNVFRRNKVYANSIQGIDLTSDGITANDLTDADTGSNNLQNFPTIDSALESAGTINVKVSLNSSSGVATNFFQLDIYKADTSVTPQASEWLGNSGCIGGNVFSNLAFSVPAGSATVGSKVVATATAYSDAACSTPTEGTSELSAATTVSGDIHWINAAGGAWETAANWSPAVVPGANDNAYIDASGTYTVSINSNVTVGTLILGTGVSGVQSLTIGGAQSLSLGGGGTSTVQTTGVLNMNGTSISGNGSLDVYGTLNWNTGNLTAAGTTAIKSGGTLNIDNASTKSIIARTLVIENGATANWLGGTIHLASGGSIDNAGLWECKVDSSINDASFGGTFDNTGTFRKSATSGTTAINNIIFNHTAGTVDIQTGTLNPTSGTAAAPFTIAAGAAFYLDGSTYAFNTGASMSGAGKIHIAGGTLAVDGAGVTIEHLLLDGGFLGGTGTVTTGATGTWLWNTGTMSGSGTAVIDNGGSLTISSASGKAIDNRTLSIANGGTVTVNGSGTIGLSNGGNIQNAGLLDTTVDVTFSDNGSDGGIVNNGTFRRSGGATTTSLLNVDFTNNNLLDIDTGIFSPSTMNNTGTVNLDGTAKLYIGGFTTTFSAGTSVTGSGLVHLVGGTLAVDAAITIPKVQIDGGTFTGSAFVSITDLTWTNGVMSGTGTTDVPNGATATISSASTKTLQRTFNVSAGGTVNVTGVAQINLSSGGNIQNAGLFDTTVDVTFNDSGSDGGFNNLGTFRKSGGVGNTTFANVDFTNNGTLEVLSGTFNPGNLTSLGSIVLNTGTFYIDDNTVTFNAGTDVSGSGLLRLVNGTLTANAGDTWPNVQIDGGTLNGSGTVSMTALTWTNGTMSDAGITNIPSGATATISSASAKTLSRTLDVDNGGTVNITGSGTINFSNGGNIANDGLVHVTSPVSFSDFFLGGDIVNTRTFRTSASTTLSNITLDNSGGSALLDVVSGTLNLSDGTSTGAIAIASGADILVDSHTYTLATGTTVTGAGTVNLTGATLAVNGNISMPNLVQSGGILDGTGVLTLTGTSSWSNGTMQGAGTTDVGNGAVFNITGASAKSLNRTLATSGTGQINLTGSGTINFSNGGNIANGGTFLITADSGFNDTFFGGNVVNTGTFRKTTATGTTSFTGIGFTNNGGVLDLQSGFFSVSGDTFTQTAGKTKLWLNGTTAGSGFAQIVLAQSPSLAGELEIALVNPYEPVGGNTFRVLSIPGGAHAGDFAVYTYPPLSGGRSFSNAYDGSGLLLTVSGNGDLSIDKSAPTNVTAGDPISYTLTVNNAGPDAANGVSVTDILQTGHSGISASGTGWTCNVVGLTVTCTAATLPTGTAPAITINATAPATPQTFTNVANVSASNDPNNTNDSDSAVVTVDPPAADLELTATSPATPIAPSTPFTFTFTIENNGPLTATNVTLTAPIPSTLTFNSAVPAAGTCNFGGGTVTCNVGNITSGSQLQVVFNLSSTATAGTHSVTALADSVEVDPDNTNDSITPEVEVTGSTIVVTNTNDSGMGSLREALFDAANGVCTPLPCTIQFNLPGPSFTIAPNSDLPQLADQTLVDGTSQPGWSGTPIVEIDGGGTLLSGLQILGSGNTIRGLSITGFVHGIDIDADGNFVEACWIGLDPTGIAGENDTGIHVTGNNNTIGGTTAAQRNVISGNSVSGIRLDGTATGNIVAGNYIGTDAAGTSARPNVAGIEIIDDADSNTIGGATSAHRNIISGNTTFGIYLEGSAGPVVAHAPRADGIVATGVVADTLISNNWIGPDATGSAAMGANAAGITLVDDTDGTTITANVVSGNNNAITLAGANVFDTTVTANLVGVAPNGTTPMGSTQSGIVIAEGFDSVWNGNTIAHNSGWGILLLGGSSHAFLSNSIFGHTNGGIDHSGDGPTPNDADDSDAGPNGLQNKPLLGTAALTGGGNVTVTYSLDSSGSPAPVGSVWLEFFEADANGEGKTWLAGTCVAGNVFSGGYSFTAASVAPGDPIVATATSYSDAACTTIADGTSEFSSAITAGNCTPPAASITASGATSFCAGGSVTLTANPGGMSYLWSTGATSQSITVNASGSYFVTVTDNLGCSNTSPATNVTVFPTPTVSITGPASACGSATLTATGGFTSYSWSNGGTGSSITVTTSGSYTVTATDANGCTATATHTVTVNPNPVATITASGSLSFCDGGSVTLTANPGGGTYSWSNGATTQSITVTNSGTFSVTVTDGNGCPATSAPVTVTEFPPASIAITGPASACGSAALTATAGFTSYAWSNGANTDSITVTSSGTYTVTGTDANGCTATASHTVTVSSAPPVVITGPTTTCASTPVTLDAGPGYASYSWSTGETTQQISVNTTGTYTVTVTGAGGCTGSDSHSVTVNPNPTPTITPDGPTAFCSGGSVTLTATPAASYAWSNGATTQSITVTNSGTFTVTVTDGNGCSGTSAPTTVTVNPSPTVAITGPAMTCSAAPATLDAGPGYTSYLWSTGATTQTISVSTTGTYSVTVTNASGCSATDAHFISVNTTPTATITPSGPTTFCSGGSVTLTASPAAQYAWSNGATTQSITVTTSGTFTVTTTDGACSATSAPVTVTVDPSPDATITTPSSANANATGIAASVPAQAGVSYNWSVTNGTLTSGQGTNAITFTAGASGVTTVSVSVTLGGCTKTGTRSLTIIGSQPATADLSITKTAPASVQNGSTLTWTIEVTNHGPSNASDVTVIDQLPSGAVFASVSGNALPCANFNNQVVCSGALGAGATNVITLSATVSFPQQAGVVTNVATVTSGSDDPDASNNSASATTTVTAPPVECPFVAVTLTAPAAGATVTSPVTFSWSAPDGEFELWINDALEAVTTSKSVTRPLPAGASSWYVIRRGSGNCPPVTSATRTFTVSTATNCPTAAPQLNTPTPNSTPSSPVTFSWTPVPGAIGYRVLIEVNGTAAQDLGTTDGAISLTASVPPGAIVAYVEALFSGCTPTRSTGVPFTINPPDPCAGRTTATPLSPANDSTVNSSSVEFLWNANGDGDGYRVWASIDGAAPAVLGVTTEETSLRTTIDRGNVEWWIEKLYNGCASTSSQHFRFTIPQRQNCSTDRPQLLSPVGVSVDNASVTFQWTAVTNAIAYEVWLAVNNGAPTLIGTTAATSLTETVAPGTLDWFVRAIVDRCPSRDSQTARFVHTPPPSCATNERVTPVAPLDQATSPVDFEWTAVAGATKYEVFTVRGNQAPNLVASTTNTFANDVALSNGNLRWFVRTHFGAGCAPLDSAETRLVVVPEPAACAALEPPVAVAAGQISSGIPFLVQWNEVAGATSYQLQIADNAAFANAQLVNTTETRHELTRSNTGTTAVAVYARVRAIDARCQPDATVTPYGQSAAVFILPVSGAEGSAPVGGGVVTHTIQLGPELAGQSFSVFVKEPWLSVTPSSGIVAAGGTTLIITANTAGLPIGTSLGSVRVTLDTPSAGNVGAHAGTTLNIPTSISKVTPVSPVPKSTPPPDALIIPAVAHADGINSKFQSDVRVTNSSAQLMKYQLTFTPTGDTGMTQGRQTQFSIEPGRTIALDDILKSWFGTGGQSITGTLEVRPLTQTATSTSGASLKGLQNLVTFASSRTFNLTNNGTFGQHIPAIPYANFIGKGLNGAKPLSLSLQQIAQSDRYRTNLGIVEGSGEPASLLIKVFGSSGQKLTEFPLDLKGGQHTQLNSFLSARGIGPVTDGRIEIQVTSPGGKVTAYASVLDQTTSDPLLVTPVTLTDSGANKWVVAGVADLDNGTANWQTDLRVFNAGETDTDAKLTFYSQNGGEPRSIDIRIPAGQVQQFDRTLANAFGITNDGGAVHIATQNAARLIATARTYNQTSTGTYGQFISAVTPDEAAGVGSRPLQLLQVEESPRFRSNIGLAEVTGQPAKIEITVVPPDAKFSAVTQLDLRPNEFRQLNALLRSVGLTDTYNARVTVRVIEGQGRVTAYASVIDMLTNDPTMVPAQ